MLTGYASRTGTRRNLAALRSNGWRLLVTPAELRPEGFAYALDNGAWSAFVRGVPFDVPAFERAVDQLGAGADWIAAPDVVGAGAESLALSLSWVDRLAAVAPVLIPVQDGTTPADLPEILGDRVGLFVGGTTGWKLSTLASWGRLAAERRCHLHVGRVNTRRRVSLCAAAGADSFDGTSISRYAVTMPLLDNARRQRDLLAPR